MPAPTAPTHNPFFEFLALYHADPHRFVREVFGMDGRDPEHTIDAWQAELLDVVGGKIVREETVAAGGLKERRIAVRSGHGVGKTTVVAWLIVHHIICKFPQKTVCTAPTSGQLFDALAAEVKTWIRKLPPLLQDRLEIKTESIHLRAAPDESFISFKTSRPETPEALAGVHSANVLLVADEASGIPEVVFVAAGGSMSGMHATTIMPGNPVRSAGYFYDAFHKNKDEWYRIHVSCEGHPRISPDFVRSMREQYGEDSNEYRVRVLGEFPLADDDKVIPADLIDAARARDVQPKLVRPLWGLDVARFGDDRTALAKRRGNILAEPVTTWQGLDTMQTVGRIKAEYEACAPEDRPEEILVDVIGIGAGVVDRLRELNLPARGINVSESPAMTARFKNLRAELWYKAKDWFATREVVFADDATADELKSVRYKIPDSSGRILVEGKGEMKKRMRKSPDRADAFVLTFAGDASTALHGESVRTPWNRPLTRSITGLP